jgi:broad-specificity NMP kinase
MKNLYIIGGTMGVGKTTTCQLLKRKLNNAVFLDGDWCWDANPFQVNDQTKIMVVDNICYLLNNFIHCTTYENVIFCWVMHEQSIIDDILSHLDISDCEVKIISLICSPEALTMRLNKDIESEIRQSDVLERSLKRIPMYEALKTIKVDVSNRSPEEVVAKISSL